MNKSIKIISYSIGIMLLLGSIWFLVLCITYINKNAYFSVILAINYQDRVILYATLFLASFLPGTFILIKLILDDLNRVDKQVQQP